jgi:hypothetical protein
MKPKISFIVTARNDNYGGDFLHRMQVFLNTLLVLGEKHRLSMELVIVEWNPPADTPPLMDALSWPDSRQHCPIRIITVSGEIHRQLPRSEQLPLFEYIGKNVGIRRALGEYILVTNPDIIFTEPLVNYLETSRLNSQCFYRATRYDIDEAIPLDQPLEEQIVFCRQHVVRINGYLSSADYRTGRKSILHGKLIGLLDYVTWRLSHFPLDRPFTNASGDFFLMHRQHWEELRGYPEIVGTDSDGKLHIDAFMLYTVLLHRLKQVKLSKEKRIYHQEHFRPNLDNLFSADIDTTKNKLLKARKPVILNDNNWGLGAHDLPENCKT